MAIAAPAPIPLGSSIPALTAHAVSVSLPKWADVVGYEEGDKRVADAMQTGYPRFFIHRSIQKLAGLCLQKFGRDGELCILLPSPTVASQGRDFLAAQTPSIPSRIVEFVVCPSAASKDQVTSSAKIGVDCIELQILLFAADNWAFAKAFWQHTGDGICSRMAERALSFMGEGPAGARAVSSPEDNMFKTSSRNRHYARRTPRANSSTPATPVAPVAPVSASKPAADDEMIEDEALTTDLATFLEERYGRNLPLFNAGLAKQALKRRIAGGLLPSDEDYGKVQVDRGVAGKHVTDQDVYLYPCGMSAIWHAHDIVRRTCRAAGKQESKSVCYGFPYTDTLKILQKWGPGAVFLGTGGTEDIPALEALLESEPILAVFAEFPSNPLLRSPDLAALRRLADKYGFVIVVDETVGNFLNVEMADLADIVVSSLTKIFSGDANVMGGSLVLNPNGSHYDDLKAVLNESYEDNYYPEDAVYMERNSRDYRNRIRRVNDNAYEATDYFFSRSLEDTSTPAQGKAVKKVYYPRWITPETYKAAQRFPTLGKGGFGGLFSITFVNEAAARAFYDTLQCAKGPSLGTSFTLACPYTLLAHYTEQDWAAQHGVEPSLVRISVGQEDSATLRSWWEEAVDAAEAALKASARSV